MLEADWKQKKLVWKIFGCVVCAGFSKNLTTYFKSTFKTKKKQKQASREQF